MATLPPPKVKEFEENSLEKLVYSLVETFEKNIPLPNDRNRLAFALLNYLREHGDPPNITVKNNKLNLEDISELELSEQLVNKLSKIKP